MITPTSGHGHGNMTGHSDLASTTFGESSPEAGETLAKEKLTIEELGEEKTVKYTEMVLELQFGKGQRIPDYAARRTELDWSEEEHKRYMERIQKAREEYERQRKESEQLIQELLEVQTMSETARIIGVRGARDEMQQQAS